MNIAHLLLSLCTLSADIENDIGNIVQISASFHAAIFNEKSFFKTKYSRCSRLLREMFQTHSLTVRMAVTMGIVGVVSVASMTGTR